MPGIEDDIRAALIADSTVSGLIAQRIYATKIPPNDTPPPWVYFIITSEEPDERLDSNDQIKLSIEFELFAATYSECRSLKLASRSVLNKFQGGHISRMLWTGSKSGPVENGHNITERYTVWSRTLPPTTTIITVSGNYTPAVSGDYFVELQAFGGLCDSANGYGGGGGSYSSGTVSLTAGTSYVVICGGVGSIMDWDPDTLVAIPGGDASGAVGLGGSAGDHNVPDGVEYTGSNGVNAGGGAGGGANLGKSGGRGMNADGTGDTPGYFKITGPGAVTLVP